jgi:hypothetical protein
VPERQIAKTAKTAKTAEIAKIEKPLVVNPK